MELNLRAFALAFGVWWGLGVFVITWILIWSGSDAVGAMELIHNLYPGYAVTPLGSLVGFVWGFICGGICGAILAWLYNFFIKKVGA